MSSTIDNKTSLVLLPDDAMLFYAFKSQKITIKILRARIINYINIVRDNWI